MLFVLTGETQSGKTRWLQTLVKSLAENGIATYGVLAPGVWADRRASETPNEHMDKNGFEKLGIDNVLLPSGERISFARRADLAEREGLFNERAQSARAKLGWHISDEAIARVNGHFTSIAERARGNEPEGLGLLVIDELGRLELERGQGLVEALRVLEAGPTQLYQHALIVVREALVPYLEGRFETWGAPVFVDANSDGSSLLKHFQ